MLSLGRAPEHQYLPEGSFYVCVWCPDLAAAALTFAATDPTFAATDLIFTAVAQETLLDYPALEAREAWVLGFIGLHNHCQQERRSHTCLVPQYLQLLPGEPSTLSSQWSLCWWVP